jgi:peptidoglycan/xylan/chitin deacetylase (PgdA/CDA1 family)
MIILGYHRVNPAPRGGLSVTTTDFRQQMLCLLHTGYTNISLQEVAERPDDPSRPKHSFAVTFDDGYRDNCLHALPILHELGLKATVFVTVNYIDTDEFYPWDYARMAAWGDPGEEDLSVTWTQIDEMRGSGVFTIGSHTLSHVELAGRRGHCPPRNH